MVKVKICGITNLADALAAVDAGADALGFVFHHNSPRHVFPEHAAEIIRHLPPFIQVVGLFVNEPVEVINEAADLCGLDVIQLHGDESPELCQAVSRRVIKAFRVRNMESLEQLRQYRSVGVLLDAWSEDAYGGTGRSFNWEIAAAAGRCRPIILAGGLKPDNVADAIRLVQPYGVDVSGGVEAGPGKKDVALMQAFIAAAKNA